MRHSPLFHMECLVPNYGSVLIRTNWLAWPAPSLARGFRNQVLSAPRSPAACDLLASVRQQFRRNFGVPFAPVYGVWV